MEGFFSLRWTNPPTFCPLPDHISRSSIRTPGGPLELLSANPLQSSSSSRRKDPILFLHGGYGRASVWLDWMSILSQQHAYPCYALSLRGHGASYDPGFIRTVVFTTVTSMMDDLVAAITEVEHREGRKCILAGHSAGGGMVQAVLNQNRAVARALVLVGAIPPFGSIEIYNNWFALDPWFLVRSFFHLQHPRSPLSSPRLVHRAFFSPECPPALVEEFARWMPNYESIRWPMGMSKPFIDVRTVLANVLGLSSTAAASQPDRKVLVLAAEKDKMVSLDLTTRTAAEYRLGLEGSKVENGNAVVGLVVTPAAGHHLQNDLQREQGAEQLAKWLDGA